MTRDTYFELSKLWSSMNNSAEHILWFKFVAFSLSRPHWANSVLELPCPSVCLDVCAIGYSFLGLSLALRSHDQFKVSHNIVQRHLGRWSFREGRTVSCFKTLNCQKKKCSPCRHSFKGIDKWILKAFFDQRSLEGRKLTYRFKNLTLVIFVFRIITIH